METAVGPCQGLGGGQCRCDLRIRVNLFIIVLQVAVKSFRYHMSRTSEWDLRIRFRGETAIWAYLVHDNIITLNGMPEGFGPTTALVSPWFPDGWLLCLITEQSAIASKLKLLHGIASWLHYRLSSLHGCLASTRGFSREFALSPLFTVTSRA
ncbi:hypothetical protein DFJ58DRAFT_30097 [Suillus subalutaceus]|uniref:uncharacterized protein n=1 Tax=Suillus subalutaceus TaxID=48586 RepID=UPI001B867534|nr:uncharacterized protein DFJ58DRAFT_30097 [Suillus subalutaceus]KAG1844163.1 hypothetical protein DFJ58DRAFT_30097 [Suillus subalutaceus]